MNKMKKKGRPAIVGVAREQSGRVSRRVRSSDFGLGGYPAQLRCHFDSSLASVNRFGSAVHAPSPIVSGWLVRCQRDSGWCTQK